VSPYLAGLDPELVKLLLRLLRSPTFLGAPALLSALACTDAESQHPVGLCKVRVPQQPSRPTLADH
jgi:hypothetical protein